MEITVKIEKILEPQSFVSKKDGNTYVTHVFVGETTNTQYPRKVAFKVMGDDRMKNMGIAVGGTYNISFDVESREWNGKFFTECQAWKAVRVDVAQTNAQTQNANNSGTQQINPQPQPQPAPQPQAQSSDTSSDPLPF